MSASSTRDLGYIALAGPVETIVEVELAAPDIGMRTQKTMVEIAPLQQDY